MRAFIATFKMGFKFLWRETASVIVLIAFPLLIIFVLGNALSFYMEADTDLEPAPVAVVADADGALGKFLRSDEIGRFFSLTFTDGQNAGELLNAGDVCAVVTERNGDVAVSLPAETGLLSNLTLSVIDSYKRVGAAAAIAELRGRDSGPILAADVSVKDVPLGKRVPGSMDYYAVTMLVMILLYTGMNGMELFHKSLLSDTGNRIRLSPIHAPAHIGGLLAASAVTSYLQGMITFVVSGAVYGVYWGERIPLVLAALFSVVLFSQALCIVLLMLFRHHGAAAGIAQALFFSMTFVSNGYFKFDFGKASEIFAHVPNAMAQTVIFGAIYGGNEIKIASCLALLFGLSGAFYICAFLLGRRRLA